MATEQHALDTWLAQNFPPGNYFIIQNSQLPHNNCIAWAIGVTDQIYNPDTWAALDNQYGAHGFYQVDVNTPFQNGDVEVYAKPTEPNRPLHAHRVTSAATSRCQSKIGEDFVIDHDWAYLQQPRRVGQRNIYRYGTVRARYRYDGPRLKKEEDSIVTTRVSGRKVKKRFVVVSSTGSFYQKLHTYLSKSGRTRPKKRADAVVVEESSKANSSSKASAAQPSQPKAAAPAPKSGAAKPSATTTKK